MKYVTRIIGLCLAVIIAIASSITPVAAADEPTKHIVIAEISPEAKDSASKEFVVLYNPNTAQVDVSGWTLQYRSASHKSDDSGGWTTKAIVGCQSTKQADCVNLATVTIAAGETLRLSSFETGDGIAALASGMATTGGEVRLVRPEAEAQQTVQDMVGYGTAADYEGKAAPAPKAGQSIVRSQDETGAFVDTDHNDADFALTPSEDNDSPVPPSAQQPGNGTTEPGKGAGDPPTTYRAAEITEVLPDPASPQLDSADEFIELYNPYAEELDLTGYVLKTGTGWTHKYTIGEVTVDPYGYVALTSAQTHLSLSNSGSGVRLYDPAGNLVVEAPSYGKAQTGSSWVKGSDGQWAWTAKPTPGEQNIVEAPTQTQTAKKITAPASASAKKTTAKAASAAKKASIPKVANSAVKGAATTAQSTGATEGNQVGMWVLAGAGVLGVGYALYEYRQEIGGFMRRRWETVAGFASRR
jgi:hypothetical protein